MAYRFPLPTSFKDKRPSRVLASCFPWDQDRGWMLRPPLGEVHIRLLRIDRHWRSNFLRGSSAAGAAEFVTGTGLATLRDSFERGFAAERDGDRESAALAYMRCYNLILPWVAMADSSSTGTFWDAVWLLLWAVIGFFPWWQLVKPESHAECALLLLPLVKDLLPAAGKVTERLRAMMALLYFEWGYATGREQDVVDAIDMAPYTMKRKHYFLNLQTPRVMLCVWLRNQHGVSGNYPKMLFWEQERSKWVRDPPFGARLDPDLTEEQGSFGSMAEVFYQLEMTVAGMVVQPGGKDALYAWLLDGEPMYRFTRLVADAGEEEEGEWDGEGPQLELLDTLKPGGALGADWFQLDDNSMMQRFRDLHSDLADMPSLTRFPGLFLSIATRVCWDRNSQLEGKLSAALKVRRGVEDSRVAITGERGHPEQGFRRGYLLYCEVLLDMKGRDLSSDLLSRAIAKLETAIAALTEYVDMLKREGESFPSSFRLASVLLSKCYWRLCMCWRDGAPRRNTSPGQHDPEEELLETDERCADGLRRFIEWRNMALDFVCVRPAVFDLAEDHRFLGLAHTALALLQYQMRHRREAAINRQQGRPPYLEEQSSSGSTHFLGASQEEVDGMRKATHHHRVSAQVISSVLASSRELGEGLLGWSPAITYQTVHDISLWLSLTAGAGATGNAMDLLLWSERSRARPLVLQLEALLAGHGLLPRCLCPEASSRTAAEQPHRGIYGSEECGRRFLESSRLACGSKTVFLEYHITGDTMSRFLEADQIVIHVLFGPGEKGYLFLSRGPVWWLSFQDMGVEQFHEAMSSTDRYEEVGGSLRATLYLEHLHRILIDPVAAVLNRMDVTDKLVISPGGILNRIPFALLRRAEDGKHLFERHTVCVAPSFLALGLSLQLQRQKKQQMASAADDTTVAAGVVANPAYLRASYRLPESVKEMDMIRDLFHDQEVVCLQDTDASPEGLLNLASRCEGFLHVAAHAEADSSAARLDERDSTQSGGSDGDPDPPSRGALLLAEGDDESQYPGGRLRAEDIMLKDNAAALASLGSSYPGPGSAATTRPAMWLPQLVVLSACDSGNGQLHDDGLINLPRAIVGAGVASVVASLWKVEDSACLELMTALYGELRKGEDITTALRLAMMRFKDDPHIYRWAAFQAWGVPTTRLPREMLDLPS